LIEKKKLTADRAPSLHHGEAATRSWTMSWIDADYDVGIGRRERETAKMTCANADRTAFPKELLVERLEIGIYDFCEAIDVRLFERIQSQQVALSSVPYAAADIIVTIARSDER
jgi:hypothetical protein